MFTPTCTGLGERAHLAAPEVGLDTHIADMLAVLEYEDLHDVVLVGHSYGGMVATGVADRAAARLSQLVYLDAFVPRRWAEPVRPDSGGGARAQPGSRRAAEGEGWRLPANPHAARHRRGRRGLGHAAAAHAAAAGLLQRRCSLTGAVQALPRSYIYCTRSGPGDVFRPFADRAKASPQWRYFELDASHNPHITMPDTLAELLHRIATQQAPDLERSL